MRALRNRLTKIAAGIATPNKITRVWSAEECDITRSKDGFTDKATGEAFTWEECRTSGIRFFTWADRLSQN